MYSTEAVVLEMGEAVACGCSHGHTGSTTVEREELARSAKRIASCGRQATEMVTRAGIEPATL